MNCPQLSMRVCPGKAPAEFPSSPPSPLPGSFKLGYHQTHNILMAFFRSHATHSLRGLCDSNCQCASGRFIWQKWVYYSFNQPQWKEEIFCCYKMPFNVKKKRYFEPTKSFFKLSDSSIVNQIRLVIAIFKCKSCSMRKETCLQFKTMTVSTHDLVYYYTRKKGFCNHCRTVSYSFFIEMLFQWCIFLFNK